MYKLICRNPKLNTVLHPKGQDTDLSPVPLDVITVLNLIIKFRICFSFASISNLLTFWLVCPITDAISFFVKFFKRE